MKKEARYAQALFTLVSDNPAKGQEYLSNLEKVLTHYKERQLLPRILAEIQRLEEKKRRGERYRAVTQEDMRSRTLVELYRTLIATN